MQQLTEKQIKRLQGTVKRYTWMKWLLLVLVFMSLLTGAIHIHDAWVLSRESGFSMQQVFDLMDHCQPKETYQGVLVIATGEMILAMLYFNVTFVFMVFWGIAYFENKKNRTLLYYIEQLQSAHHACDSKVQN